MAPNKLQKIFGVGPRGALISLVLLSLFVWADSRFFLPVSTNNFGLIKTLGIILIILGLGLHCWSFFTLRHWWSDNELCTSGPFKYVRHPMYAAWISLISPGIALYLNSWLFLPWVILLHPIWHTEVLPAFRFIRVSQSASPLMQIHSNCITKFLLFSRKGPYQ